MDSKKIDASQYMKDSIRFFDQLITGEGLGLSNEHKELYKKELQKNGAIDSFNKLKEEIKNMANKK